jgi:Carboxypeptidase regulatory-like domain
MLIVSPLVKCLLLAALLVLSLPGAEIYGTVVSSADGKVLNRAEVVLRSPESGKTAVGVTTNAEGSFTFLDVPKGRYLLQVSRDGYVPSIAAYHNGGRLMAPFLVENDTTGLTVRLYPAATISGKVRHSDGEPASRLLVQAYREVYERNQHRYEVAARATTDDRGEYRLYGLPPGRYYVAAVFQPYQGKEDVREELVRDAYGQRVAPERTVTTFAPSTWKLNEATAFAVRHGLDIATADIFLARSRTTTIKGRILNARDGQPAEGPSLVLMREDASGDGYMPYPSVVRPLDRGEYEIRGVTPGRYVLEARGADRRGGLFARQPITVGNAPEVTANIVLLPEVDLKGQILAAARGEKVPPGLHIAAEPRGAGATRSARVHPDGQFILRLSAGETYDILLQNPPGNVHLKTAKLDATDVLGSGVRLDSAGPTTQLLLTVGERGGEIRGETMPGANVTLMPQQPLLYRFSETGANEWGLFAFGALAPGDYRLMAWFDEPPCEVWSPQAATLCSNFGQTLRVGEGGSYTVTLQP